MAYPPITYRYLASGVAVFIKSGREITINLNVVLLGEIAPGPKSRTVYPMSRQVSQMIFSQIKCYMLKKM